MRSRNGGAWQVRRGGDEGRERRRDGFGRSLWPVALSALVALSLAACTAEGQEQVGEALENVSTTGEITLPEVSAPEEAAPEPEPEPAPEPEPEPEPAPEPEAPAPAPEAEAPVEDEEGLSSGDWVLLILLVVAAVALIGAAISAAGRYSASKAARKNAVSTRIGDIVGSSRWIHDSGSMEVLLVQDPAQIQSAWAPVRTRMMDVESQIATLAANTSDTELQNELHGLGQAVTGLRSAEEAYVTTKARAVGPDAAELLRSSNQSVIDRRRDLQMAIEPVAAQLSYR